MNDNGIDPRVICNEIIQSQGQTWLITNLSLQKLLYFSHVTFLVRYRAPLVSGYFEAWTYGPVHPGAYEAFKRFGSGIITELARGNNLLTGEPFDLPPLNDSRAASVIKEVYEKLGSLSAASLVRLSHAEGSAWEHVVDNLQRGRAVRPRIPNRAILERSARLIPLSHSFREVPDDAEDAPLDPPD